jgi:CysZ protein
MTTTNGSNNPITGAGFFIQGIKLIFKPGILRYAMIPLLINISLFSLIFYYGIDLMSTWTDSLVQDLPEWLQWLSWLLTIIIALSLLLVVFFTFSLVGNIISAPFNGFLAEAVEYHLTGQKPESSATVMSEIGRAIKNELTKIAYFMVRGIPLLILFLIPVLNLIAPWAWMAYTAWMLALEYSDYPLGNHAMSFTAQRELAKQKRFLTLGFGGTVMFATAIPLLNFFVIPSAVAGATALWVKNRKDITEIKT